MGTIDYILIALLVVAIHRAIGYAIRHKGSCCGDCSQCASNCNSSNCKKREEDFHETDKR